MTVVDEPALFLTVTEAAAAFGVSDDLVYDLIARREIPVAEFGRRKMIPRRAVELTVEHALDGFDPARLASAVGFSSTAVGTGDENPTGQAGRRPTSSAGPDG